MPQPLEAYIVRIFDVDGQVAGAGLLVAERLVLTCAHVVARSQGLPDDTARKPETDVRLDFPFLAPGQKIEAHVAFWEPPSQRARGDIAGLALRSNPPGGAEPAPFTLGDNLWGHPFRAYGFPEGYDDGVFVSGVLRARTVPGWVQVDVDSTTGFAVEEGFSGAPVWDERLEGVVGMVVARETAPGIRVAFVTPARILGDVSREPAPVPLDHAPALQKLRNVPDLPPYFLPRPARLGVLKEALVGDATGPPGRLGGPAVVTLDGMAGVGKSVLATALARDAEVQQAFPDGVIWVTLGQDPTITTRQLDVAVALGTNPGIFHDEQHGKTHLGRILTDKACLLILDDVWNVRDATAFYALGARCRMLITTRHAAIGRAMGAVAIRLDALTDEQAAVLLADWAGQAPDRLPDIARDVARECGNLPLALAMVGAMAERRPDGWRRALRRLQTADLSKIRHEFPGYPYPSLLQAIEVSVDALEPYQRERYLDLAVFPEDTPISQDVLETLWQPQGLDEHDVRDLVESFEDRSLLWRDERGQLSLHDLHSDYVRTRCGDPKPLHDQLVKGYAARCPEGWPTGPNDGYFFQHLPGHLLAAGRRDELAQLLFDFDWLQATLDATDANTLLGHFDYMPEHDELGLVQGAIRLSAHVLARDRTQLAGQLLGRPLSREAAMGELLEQAAQWRGARWLRPLTGSLTSPGGPLLRTLQDHGNWVLGVAVTSDGRWAVSGSRDETLRIWDLQTGAELGTLRGHRDWVNAVAVIPGRAQAVSASSDGTLKVWDLEARQELCTLHGHEDWVLSVAVTPDGCHAVSGSSDKTLRVWDLKARTQLATLRGHTDAVHAVAVERDGKWAISGAADATLRIWDLRSGSEMRILEGHEDAVRGVAVTPDGRQAVSASQDRSIRLWDLQDGRQLRVLGRQRWWFRAVAVTPDGGYAISGSDDNTVGVWPLKERGGPRTLGRHADWVYGVAVTPDGGRVVSAASDATVKVWDLAVPAPREHALAKVRRLSAAAVAAHGGGIICGSSDRRLQIWDLGGRTELHALVGHRALVRAVAVTPDGRWALSGAADATLKVWDLESGTELRTIAWHAGWISAVALTPDGQRAAAGYGDGTVRVWDIRTGRQLHAMKAHNAPIWAVAITLDGRRAVSGSADKSVRVWDMQTGAELRALKGHAQPIWAVAATADGRRVLSGSDDGTVNVWDVDTGARVRCLEGHAGRVRALTFTCESRIAISGSADTTVTAWDLETGTPICSFSADAQVLLCAIAGDGETIVAIDDAGGVHFLALEQQ